MYRKMLLLPPPPIMTQDPSPQKTPFDPMPRPAPPKSPVPSATDKGGEGGDKKQTGAVVTGRGAPFRAATKD